ncbi:MAG: hypothetical protein U9R47_07375, partial [Actinomycetota bacterium]|nr:hypothetical protein [Actinomycetota bacterium]
MGTSGDEHMSEMSARETDRLQKQVASLKREVASERERREEVERALERQRRLVAKERQRHGQVPATVVSGASPKKLASVEKNVTRLERKLRTVYASRTWRAGRIAWHIYHARKLLLRKWRGTRGEPVRTAGLPPVSPDPDPDPAPVRAEIVGVDYTLTENHIVREKYEAALTRVGFPPSDTGRNVAVAVYTTNLNEGRGDVFTAVGLGRRLEKLGYNVVYLPRDRWYDVPENT